MSDEAPRLYLVTPLLEEPLAFLPKLEEALGAADVASVLLRLAPSRGNDTEPIISSFAAPVQRRGAALLLEGTADLVLRTGADGLHVAGCGPELSAAVKRLAPEYIVGAGALASRDDAMRAGEVGADYVLFGDLSSYDVVERTRWWAELFNTPCVAVAEELDQVDPLAAAEADFIMLGECVWRDPRGPAAAVSEAASRIRAAMPPETEK